MNPSALGPADEPRCPQPGQLSILLPAHNEASIIAGVLEAFHHEVAQPAEAELIVCEDGSTDGTRDVLREIAERWPIRVVSEAGRKGYAGAVRGGLSQLKTPYVFFSDSDGQYDPRDFWRLWPNAEGCDMVIGRKVDRREPFHRIALSKGFHVLVKTLFDVPLLDMDCGFRIIRRRLLDEVLPAVRTLKYSFWAEFTIVAYRRGYRIVEVPITHRSRPNGNTTIYKTGNLPGIVLHQLGGLVVLRRRLLPPPERS